MSTTANKPSRRQTKAAQDRAAREAKAAEAKAAKAAEAKADEPEAPSAPEADAPEGTEPESTDAGEGDEAEGSEPEADEWFEELPKMERSADAKPGAWTDRLNSTEERPGQWKTIFTAKSPRTANTTASTQRKRMREGLIGGLAEGGTFEIACRGSKILARFVPTPAEAEAASDPAADGEASEASSEG